MRSTPSLRSFSSVAVSNVRLTDNGHLSSFQGRLSSASSFHVSLLQAIDGVMPLALCPQVVSQSPHHFRSSEKQATCEGCFARQSIRSVISLRSGPSLISRTVSVDVKHHVYLLTSLRHVQGSTSTGVFEGGCMSNIVSQ